MNRAFTTERRRAWDKAERETNFITCPKERSEKANEVFEREFERIKLLSVNAAKKKASGESRYLGPRKYAGEAGCDYSGKPCTIDKIREYS